MTTVKDNKRSCSGCTACAAVCPVGAISMHPDREGFLYPQIDTTRCTDCGLCRKVCAFGENYIKSEPRTEQTAHAAQHLDCDVQKKSRSGGAFVALANAVLGMGGVVYGTALDENLKAVVARIDTPDEISRLQGSKYVQSEKGDAFARIRRDLQQGTPVFFSGTACEVAGLLSYLAATHTDTAKLYTADLVCHSVPSPLIWEEHITELTRRYGKIDAACFRDKSFGWHSHIETYRVGDREIHKNLFSSLFYLHVISRPSCAVCPFTNMERCADITLADFWGISEYGFDLDTENGVSLIFTNTKKGEALREEAADSLRLLKAEGREFVHPNLKHPTKESDSRAAFWAYYHKNGYQKTARHYYRSIDRARLTYNIFKRKLKNRGDKK